MEGLQVVQISKIFQGKAVLRQVSFEIGKGEILALLGPSGCGKSTLLNIIAGIENPDGGNIFWNGTNQKGIPTHLRGFGLMFQDFMLFPHKNVFANVAFGLEMNNWKKQAITKRVKELLGFIGLSGYGNRNVSSLSGGEQQRVALARSLAPKPSLLMLDEPIGSLDRTLREDLLIALREILNEVEQSVLYVTHDQEEAFAISDRVAVMSPGQIAQIGTPEAIYSKPSTIFVAKFLGFTNIFPGKREDNLIKFPFGNIKIFGLPTKNIPDGKEFTFLIRPEYMKAIRVSGDQSHKENQIKGIIKERLFRGNHFQITITINGMDLRFDLPSDSSIPEIGNEFTLFYNPLEAIQVLR